MPFIPFHLISVFLIWQNIKLGKDFGYIALRDFNYSNTVFSVLTSSNHPSLRDLGIANCNTLFHRVRESPSLNRVSMEIREWLYLLCLDGFGKGKKKVEVN